MKREEAKAALQQATGAIQVCANLLRPHVALFQQYEKERRNMDNFGHIVDPTLFKDSERRAVDAIVGPLFKAAEDFLRAFDIQIAAAKGALEKVQGE